MAEAGPHHERRGPRPSVDVGEACAAAVKLVVPVEGDGERQVRVVLVQWQAALCRCVVTHHEGVPYPQPRPRCTQGCTAAAGGRGGGESGLRGEGGEGGEGGACMLHTP